MAPYCYVPIQTFKRRRVTLGWVVRSLVEIAVLFSALGFGLWLVILLVVVK